MHSKTNIFPLTSTLFGDSTVKLLAPTVAGSYDFYLIETRIKDSGTTLNLKYEMHACGVKTYRNDNFYYVSIIRKKRSPL